MKILSFLFCLTAIALMNGFRGSQHNVIIKRDQVSLYTEHFGEKENPAVLLLAGATASMLYWDEEFCQKLADKGFYVIRYDNRDVGKSTYYKPGKALYTIVDFADDAISILNKYGIKKAHLVGMSLGGSVSQIAALKYPERVASLTLMSTGPWGDSDPAVPEMDKKLHDFEAKAVSVNWSDENSVTAYMLEAAALMSGRKSLDKDRIEQRIRAEHKRANFYVSMFNHASIGGGEEFYNRLGEIHVPTLLIHGTDDRIWHFGHTKVMLEKIKGSKLIKLQGTGHELHYDDWDTIINGIEQHASSKAAKLM
ncbi:macrolide hydrolase EstT [Emticicia sp. 21SJ11W-3]|uniref:macrolide hydrolase EstT n=1 Tax=Emticicia sp. 21SJ11W-3 TaxID=2916755 RepID=UPI0020A074C7|nr:macrolide hydrolase EstT [Emticicia sp. 21SJ11W-3]UTA69203.1 alpha/beta fold hydrolase [Emticicia sp. 21SJ11W-3]